MIIYDIEIANPIAPKNPAERDANLFYAKDFNDYENMGVACLVAYEYTTDKYHIFGEYEIEDFNELVKIHDVVVGFNNIRFDNNILKTYNVEIPSNKSYDILSEIQSAIGFQKGCKLENVIKANFPNAAGKTMDGAQAPLLWQRGYHMKVTNYCLNDVRLTKMLLDRILRFGWLKNPVSPDKILKMRRP